MVRKPKIKVSGYYEDSDNHPVLCTEYDGDDVSGISLLDGSGPRCDSILHGSIRKLSFKQAIELREVWQIVMPPKVREAYHGKNRMQIMHFAGYIHHVVLDDAVSGTARLEDIFQKVTLFAHNSSVELSELDLWAAMGLSIIRQYTANEIDLNNVKKLAHPRFTPFD